MPQMTGDTNRVVNPVLSEIAIGYKHPSAIGYELFPRAPVNVRAGKVIEFDQSSFLLYNTARAPGANAKRIRFGHSSTNYALVDNDLDVVVPWEHMQDATVTPDISLSTRAIRVVQRSLALGMEKEQADLARAAANYGTNTDTLSGTDQWSDATSDPVNAVEDAKGNVADGTGEEPNVFWMSRAVFKQLKTHPDIIERTKRVGLAAPTEQALAEIFDVSKVVVGKMGYVDSLGGTFNQIWGKDAGLVYVPPGEADSEMNIEEPSFGYTYELTGHPVIYDARNDADARSWIHGMCHARKAQLTGVAAGYLFKDAVA